jgi:paraquat-inducible protein B
MSHSDHRPALIGGFVLGALALLVLGTLVFGGQHWWAPRNRYIVYFDSSVNGLSLGAPVKLKGVAIGKVSDILVEFDKANNRVLTPVVIDVELEHVMDVGSGGRHQEIRDIGPLIQRGLRAQLQMSSLVTGQLYVDVNFYPNTPANLVGHKDDGMPEIPSIRSSQEEIQQSIEEAVREVRKLPLHELFNALLATVQQLQQLTASADLAGTLQTLNGTLQDTRRLVNRVDGRFGPLADSMQGTLDDSQRLARQLGERLPGMLDKLDGTLQSLQRSSAALEHLSGRNAPLENTLSELSAAARSLRGLAEYLERNPNALLYGKEGHSR